MRDVVALVTRIATSTASVLVTGESGTGKELIARAIHFNSARTNGAFIPVNLAAVPEGLIESELFGHKKGAFTDARADRPGLFVEADGGTIFLDEIGELALPLQAKLLRVLQERRFERVGGTRTLEVDVRWIAATNRDLRAMIDEGLFREDLYHRFAVFPIKLPPLRERPADLLPLAKYLLERIARDLKRPMPRLTAAAEKRLVGAAWRGNVRELANTLERAAILADGDAIDAPHVWIEEGGEQAAKSSSSGNEVRPLVELEKEAILHALEVVGGNRRRAAELLGIGERTLYDKLKRYGVDS